MAVPPCVKGHIFSQRFSAVPGAASPASPRRQHTQPAADTAAMTARAYQPPPAPLSSPSGSFMALNAAWAAKPGKILPVRLRRKPRASPMRNA